MYKDLPSGRWCMWSVFSKRNEDALSPTFTADSTDFCCAVDDSQSLGIMRPGIRRLWRGVGGMCSRLLAGLFCLSRVFTPTAPEDDSFRRGEGDKQRSKFVWKKEKKKRKKHPRTTAKHSALKQARFPCVACCYQRDKKQNRGMSVSATRSGMRWSVSWLDELTSPNILYQVCMREKAEQCPGFWLFCWFSKCLNF